MYPADSMVDHKLYQYFMLTGEWEKVSKYEKADLVLYTKENNIKWDTQTGVMINKVPGFVFLCRKKMQAVIFNIYKELYFAGEHPYFPETFLMAEDHPKYVSTHTQHPERQYIDKMTTGSAGIGTKHLRTVKDFKFDNATVNNKICDQVV